MSEITNNPSVPTQVVAKVTFPKCVSQLGIIPTSYKDSMSYYETLAWLCKYLEETVIPTVNQNGEAVEELQGLYVELKNYVEHYFDDLDIQENVNIKLDEMVEDGTLAEIINQEIFSELNNEIGDLDNLTTTSKTSLVSAVNEVNENTSTNAENITTNTNNILQLNNDLDDLELIKLRKESKNYQKFTIPEIFNSFLKNNLNIFYNGYNNYIAEIDESLFKNIGGTTRYISPNGNNSNDGSTPALAKKTFLSAYNASSAGDTIVFLNGLYGEDNIQMDQSGFTQSKPINIIGESKDGVFISGNASNLSWSQNETYNNVYQVSRSNTVNVIFSNNLKDFIKLVQVASLSEVANTKWSWAIVSNVVYINIDNNIPSFENTFLGVNYGKSLFNFSEFNASGKIWIENINIINHGSGGISVTNNSNNTIYLGIKNCKVLNCGSGSYQLDNISNVGCISYFEKVECYNGKKDGFNYHKGTNLEAFGIEYNCKANTFGIGNTASSQLSNNATTCHNECEIIRINGEYGNCNGAVIADVDSSKALNINCKSIDSLGDVAGRGTSVLIADSGTSYNYDCYYRGIGIYSMCSQNARPLYYKNCSFVNSYGNCIELS